MDKPERLNNIRLCTYDIFQNILKPSLFGILLTKEKNIKTKQTEYEDIWLSIALQWKNLGNSSKQEEKQEKTEYLCTKSKESLTSNC